MSSMTDYLENTLLNAVFKRISYASPTNTFAALFTSNPGGDAPTTGEVSGGWYARQSVAWSTASGGVVSNEPVVTFPPVTGSEVTVTHLVIYDAVTGGNALFHAPLTASKTLAVADSISFAVGAITVTLQ